MTQTTTCDAPDCEEELRADRYGRGGAVMHGDGFYCDMDCVHAHQRSEINRVLDEMRS